LPVAVNCCFNPSGMAGFAGVTEIDDSVYPRPLSVMVWETLLLSVIITVDVRTPVAVGAKLQLAVQLAPFFRLVGQFQLCGKSAVEDCTAMFRIVLPLVFVMVTVWAALVVPSNCLAKLRDVAKRVKGGATPVPLRLAVCGLVAALSATVSTPVRDPGEEGVNVTTMLQDPPAGTLRPALHVLDAPTEKSPLAARLEMVIGVVWPLLRLTVWAVLVPTV
jgi:hypothetical protein